MTTLQFNCPQCGQVCAFGSRYIGRRARCTKCSARFVIPADGQSAQLIKQPTLIDGPYSGFWKALMLGTPKAFLHPQSILAIGLMVILSVIRFYIGHPMNMIVIIAVLIPFGIITSILTLIFQCRYLFDIIQSTCNQEDPMPWVLEGKFYDRLFQSIFAAHSLLLLTAASLLPAGLMWFVLKKSDIQTHWPVMAATAIGLFFLPLSLTIYAYSRDIILSFRLDFVLRAARKAFWPHLAIYLQILVIAILFWQSSFYARNAPPQTLEHSALFHGLTAGLSILAARTAGLFYRHYGCYLP